MDIGKFMLESVKKNLNVPGLINDALDGIVEPALRNAVAQSETKIDDVIVAALFPLIEAELKNLIQEKWQQL